MAPSQYKDMPLSPLPPERPWLKLKKETSKAYAAFRAFRDMGVTRTVTVAYRIHIGDPDGVKKVPVWWWEWKRIHRWEERIAAYEAMLAEKQVMEELKERREDRQLRKKAAKAMIHAGAAFAEKYLKLARSTPDLKVAEVVKLREAVESMQKGIDELRREWNEEPTQHHQITTQSQIQTVNTNINAEFQSGVTLRELTPDALRHLDAGTLVDVYQAGGDTERIEAALEEAPEAREVLALPMTTTENKEDENHG